MEPPSASDRQKPITLGDVAERAGVSSQTVSRVVNRNGQVKAETRTRILEAIEELGYRPNVFARGLVTRRSHAIGLVVGDIANPFFPGVARGVQDVAEQNGYNVFVCNFGGSSGDELDALKALATQGADGCIFFSAGARPDELHAFAETFAPLVAVNATCDHPNVTTVRADLHHGGAQVADHLLATGRTRLAMIGADYDYGRQSRMTGFCDRAEERRHRVDQQARVFAPPTTAGGASAVAELVARGVSFDAIFAFNDLVALGAIRALADLGIGVPQDCAVVGCDDLEIAEVMSPTLTSLHMDRYELGSTAARVLLDRIEHEDKAQRATVLPTTVKVRESSRPPAATVLRTQ